MQVQQRNMWCCEVEQPLCKAIVILKHKSDR